MIFFFTFSAVIGKYRSVLGNENNPRHMRRQEIEKYGHQ